MARPARVRRLPASRTCSRTHSSHGNVSRFETLSPPKRSPPPLVRIADCSRLRSVSQVIHRRVDSTRPASARWHCVQLGAHSKSSSSTTGRSSSRRHSSAQACRTMHACADMHTHAHTPGPWATRTLTRHPAALAAPASKRCAAPARAQHSWDGSARTAAAQLVP